MRRSARFLFCLVLSFLILAAVTVASAENYSVWVNGEQFTDEKLTIACGSGTATLTPPAGSGSRYTVTLTDAVISGCYTYSGNRYGVYSAYDLDVIVKGTNTIALKIVSAVGLSSKRNLTLKGDGDLTVVNSNGSCGILADSSHVNIAMNGDLTVSGGKFGIVTRSMVDFTGAGNITITGCDTPVRFEEHSRFFTLSGSGNVNLAGTNYGISFGEYSKLELKGSGTVTISGGKCGVRFMTQNEYSATGGIRLNGTESPVTIFTTGGSKAIVDGDVSGFSMSHYKVTGDPDETKVVYTYFMNLPPTGDTASPLLW
ncbi:MAG: hypothetical protein MJ142_07910, partial [Clostridia bacterium]|nr:hypothetical protein [Clostridia bacterium]